MAPRRLLALLALIGLAVVGLVLPAAAQTQAPPAISINDMSPRCIDRGGEGFVSGAVNRPAVQLQIVALSGKVVFTGTTQSSGGGYAAQFGFSPSEVGEHEARVTAGFFSDTGFVAATPVARAAVFIQVPCRAPTIEFDPPCATSTAREVRVTGRLFHPVSNGYVDIGNDGSEELSRIPIDERGTFSAVAQVAPSTTSRSFRARDLEQNAAVGSWPPCPPGTAPTTTTSTSTTTTAPPVVDPDPDPDPGPGPDPTPETTTTLPPPGDELIPEPVLPPTIVLPPATPGATLTVAPKLGPAGFVTGVVGTGFPPGPVTLVWTPGIGSVATVAGLDGTINTRVLVFPGDRLGPRALVATGGSVTAFDAFLVVPSTVQPSGQEVSQINRIRRFNNR